MTESETTEQPGPAQCLMSFVEDYRRNVMGGTRSDSTPTEPAERGYLYALLFRSGVVKVGRTQNPEQRLRQHGFETRAAGDLIIDSWLSELHPSFCETESALVKICASRGRNVRADARNGRVAYKSEYFTDLHFPEVIRIAKALVWVDLSEQRGGCGR